MVFNGIEKTETRGKREPYRGEMEGREETQEMMLYERRDGRLNTAR